MNVTDIIGIITNEFKYFRFNIICLQTKWYFFVLFCPFLFFDLVLFLFFGVLYCNKTVFTSEGFNGSFNM